MNIHQKHDVKSSVVGIVPALLLSGAFLLVLASPALAQSAPGAVSRNITHRARAIRHVVVRGPLVTLGDLFDNVDPAINKPVFRSPDPGTTGKVSVSRVLQAARKFGLSASAPAELDKVSITRSSRVIRLKELKALVRDELDTRSTRSGRGELVMEITRSKDKYHLPLHIKAPIQLASLNWSARSGLFRAVFHIDGADNIDIRGKAQLMVRAALPRNAIAAGQIIQASDLEQKRINARLLRDNSIINAEDILGMAAKRRLRAGAPVSREDLEQPKLIHRNQMVTILLELPGLVLRAEGRALSDASMGEAVKVMNTQSKRIIHATARGQGLVSVAPAGKYGRSGS